MLAKTWQPDKQNSSCFPAYAMPKLNGLRALYNPATKQWYTRNLEVWRPAILQHIRPPASEYILDGELYCHGMPLQAINSAVGVVLLEPTVESRHIVYHIFDVMTNEPAAKRWRRISNMMATDSANCALVPHKFCQCSTMLRTAHEAHIAGLYEGTMIKPLHGMYETASRSNYLWKWKAWDTEWFQVHSKLEGIGRLVGSLGAYMVSLPERGFTKPFRVGTGPALTDDTRKQLWSAKLPARVLVKYCGLTKAGVPVATSVQEIQL